ncbi:ubiquinol-cytochrome-c reductase complex assembly factor 1 [Trichonephila clavipes]|nr:ubiquinol-cytochrome-c reductase complex assembly factor 1 [Trichonephila clavipes]
MSAVVNSSGVSRLVNLKRKVFDAFSASTKIKLGAVVAYERCADSLDYSEFFSYFKLPDTFQSWFLTLQLHVWMCSAAVISETKGKVFRNQLIHSMWNDVELRLNNLKEIRSSARKEYLANMVEQFQAAMISYDEGLHSHDVVLAAAAWRTIYGFRPVDPRVLEALILYIRKQVDHLDSLNSEDVMFRGTIEFLPLQNIGRVVVYRASTPQVLGSINGLGKVDSAFHSRYIGSINEYQACLGLNTEGLSSDRPPNRDICSCTSAPNGHVYWDGHSSSWPSWIVVSLSLSFKFEDAP